MIDIKYIRENPESVKNACQVKGFADHVDEILALDKRVRELKTITQTMTAEKNKITREIPAATDKAPLIARSKEIGNEIAADMAELADKEAELNELLHCVPQIPSADAPIGRDDSDNVEVRRVGTPREFDFEPKDHVQLGEELDIIDFDRGTKVSGPKFYYLKNEAVFLEQALIMYALNILRKHNFQMFITPDVAKEEVLKGIGFNPRGNESNVYSIEEEGTCLVATAEITLGGYHQDEILDKESLPRFYGGLSHCFRREAGAAGQFSKGLYRVHQFDKVEMFAYSTPEQSDEIHEKLRQIEEEIFEGLGLPFHVVDTCTGDLGAPAYRKWDLEAWMPGRNGGEYGEVTSTSNCTDYQARRLNIKYKDDDGKNKYVHTLNGTAIAVGRAMLAILENYQNADGSVTIPEVLVPYCGFDTIKPKK